MRRVVALTLLVFFSGTGELRSKTNCDELRKQWHEAHGIWNEIRQVETRQAEAQVYLEKILPKMREAFACDARQVETTIAPSRVRREFLKQEQKGGPHEF